MAVVSLLPHVEFEPIGHREDALHFIHYVTFLLIQYKVDLLIEMLN